MKLNLQNSGFVSAHILCIDLKCCVYELPSCWQEILNGFRTWPEVSRRYRVTCTKGGVGPPNDRVVGWTIAGTVFRWDLSFVSQRHVRGMYDEDSPTSHEFQTVRQNKMFGLRTNFGVATFLLFLFLEKKWICTDWGFSLSVNSRLKIIATSMSHFQHRKMGNFWWKIRFFSKQTNVDTIFLADYLSDQCQRQS